jgi:hypothetical protein
MRIYGGMTMMVTGRIGLSYTRQIGYNASRQQILVDTIDQPAAPQTPESAETGK